MPYPKKGYRPRRRRTVRRRTGRKIRQFSEFGMKALSTGYGYGGRRAQNRRRSWIENDMMIVNKPFTFGGNSLAQPVDGYLQRTQTKIVTGYKPKTTLARLTKEVHQRSEPIVFRFSGIKALDDNGYYFANCGLNAGSTATMLPMYIYDLTAINNVSTAGASINASPFKRAKWDINNSNIYWDSISGVNVDGSTTTSNLVQEYRSWNSTLAWPHEKSRLLWTDVKMNLWGSQTKATAYTIQLVKFYDDNADPWNTPTNQLEHSSFWQTQIKPYIYNPIAYSGQRNTRRLMKVLKTFRREIQPTSTTESDTDPHCVTLKLFSKWYRDLSYKTKGGKLLDGNTTNTIFAPDYVASNQADMCDCYCDTKDKIFLLIRAEVWNRQDDPTINNTASPSFDLSVRTCHEAQ